MPSLGSGEATALARTTVSPVVTNAAPDACLAMRPVSKTRRLPPASSTDTSCLDIESSIQFFRFHFFRLGNLWGEAAWEGMIAGNGREIRLVFKQAAHKRVGYAQRSRFLPPACETCQRDSAQPIAVRCPWQR